MSVRCALAFFLVLGLAGCASHRPKVNEGQETVRKERTSDKLFERGVAVARLGDLTRAEQYLVAAIEEGGDADQILPVLVRVCVEGGRYRVAIEHVQRRLQQRPGDVHLRYLLGTLHAAVGSSPAAREQFERVLEQQPGHADAHYALAVVWRDSIEDLARADHHFRQYLRLKPEGPHAEEARASLLKSVP